VIATFSSGSFYTPGGAPITITVSVADPKNIHYGFQMTARLESDLANGQAGVAAGFPGLYQINFVVPPDPQNGISQCSLPGTYGPRSNRVISNLTVSFGGSFSFDSAGICVVTQIPVD
jgi:uncharacterized protein (TIGR03437 family)